MADTWVTVPLDQLVKQRQHADGVRVMKRCTLCNDQTVPGAEQFTDEQIRIHMQRRHSSVVEATPGRLPARMRARLIALGWTPPADDDRDVTAPEGHRPA